MSFCRHSTPNSSPVSWIQSRRRLVSKRSRSQSVVIRAVSGNSTMANSVRVAVVQMTSVNDIAANFATCSRLVKVPFDFRLFRCYMFFMLWLVRHRSKIREFSNRIILEIVYLFVTVPRLLDRPWHNIHLS